MNISYDYIWQIYQSEKATNTLQLIPKSFYSDVQAFVSELDTANNEESTTIKTNTIRIVDAIFQRRKQKIMVYVAYGKQQPQPAPAEEAEFYNALQKLFSNENLSAGKMSKPSLHALRDIPEIFLPSGNKIGPINKSSIVEVSNEEDAAYLMSNKLCELS
jgi:hypothetical protein